MFMIRRLQDLARKKRIPLYVCFIDLTKAYDSRTVDRTLLWTVLARFGVPQNHLGHLSIPRWYASIGAEQDLRQGCMLAPLLFSIFFAAVINMASTRFKAAKGIMGTFVLLREKKGGGGKQLPESQYRRRRFGACFMLTMPGSSRNHPSSWGR